MTDTTPQCVAIRCAKCPNYYARAREAFEPAPVAQEVTEYEAEQSGWLISATPSGDMSPTCYTVQEFNAK